MEKPIVNCLDCRVDTFDIKEFYMVHDELWRSVITVSDPEGRKFLCITCLERRLGRKLQASDFMDAPVNKPNPKRMSTLLLDRLNAVR